MNHIGEIIAGLSFGILVAVIAVPSSKHVSQPSPIPVPELLSIPAPTQSAARDSGNLPPVVNEAFPSLPTLAPQQQQSIKNIEERLGHIDAQTKRIEKKLEALDERAP